MKRNESYLQSECVRWFRLAYPKYAKLLIAIPNGGSRNVLEAANLKRQGVIAGVADLILLINRCDYSTLCIEMKIGKGKQSDLQKEWQEAVEKENNKYVICRSVDEFMEVINKYLEV